MGMEVGGGRLRRLGASRSLNMECLGMPIITLYKLDEATDLSPPALRPPSPPHGLQRLQSEHMTRIPRGRHTSTFVLSRAKNCMRVFSQAKMQVTFANERL